MPRPPPGPLLLLWLASLGLAAPPAPGLDDLFARLDRPRAPGCAVAIADHGARPYLRAFGLADLGSGVPITTATRFDIASLSKVFTGTCLALLVDDGSVSLADDVRRWVPELPRYRYRVTLDHLAHHTGGLPELPYDQGGLDTDADVLAWLAAHPRLSFRPGTRVEYSNAGFVLLGVVVARVAGKPLAEVAAERIFGPLGMADTGFLRLPRALGYRRAGGRRRPRFELFDWPSEVVGDGGVFATAPDLLRWGRALLDPSLGALGRPEARALLLAPGALADGTRNAFGIGLILDEFRGRRRVWHSGRWCGSESVFFQLPDDDLTIVVLANRSGSDPIGLAERIADRLRPPSHR